MSTASLPTRMRAAQILAQGGIDEIEVREVDVPQPGPGQVLYKVEYAGVNFIDTYQRGGIYKLPMPFILGNESAGEVVALGEGGDMHGLKVGDKVAAYTPGGSMAEYAVNTAAKTVKLPQGVSTRTAATALVQGLTAVSFVEEAYKVRKGDWILVHAAAGGLGLLLCQLGKHLGAHTIGTTSTREKAQLALDAGAEHVILSDGSEDVVKRVWELTGGEGIDRGVAAVFDGVGKDTFESDFDIVKRKGTIVSLGNASGPVPPFAPLKLGPKNLKVCRPVLNQYVHLADEFQHYTSQLFRLLEEQALKLSVHKEYDLTTEGIRQTQIDITSRKTSGKLLVKIA